MRRASQFDRHPAGELDLIRRIRARAGPPGRGGLRLGIGDDCALLRLPAGQELAVTTDLTIAGRHFELAWHPPQAVGHRTLARGLSDLAAMGARPVAAFLSLGLPRELVQASQRTNAKRAGWTSGRPGIKPPEQPGKQPGTPGTWIDSFLDGFFALAGATGTPLAGGDLAESPIFMADIVLLGAVRRGRALLRSGAQPGDLLYITGALGGAASGLATLADWAGRRTTAATRIPVRLESALARHLWPQPRLAQGQWLVKNKAATSALDISDGLSTDLTHLCEESGVATEIHAASVPLYPGASLQQALHGGEDYELLFTASPATRLPRAIAGVAVTRIGRVVRKNARRPQVTLVTERGLHPLTPRGWEHFAGPQHWAATQNATRDATWHR